MTKEEILEYIMKNVTGKSGLAAVGPIIDNLVNFVAWQQEHIEDLERKVEVLQILGANK